MDYSERTGFSKRRCGGWQIALAALGLFCRGVDAADSSVAISLDPATVSLHASQVQALTATVTGSLNPGVIWSFKPAVGALWTAGNYAAYITPGSIPMAQTVTITATSIADKTKAVSSVINLVPLITFSLMPGAVTLGPAGTQQFNEVISGLKDTAVAWSRTPAVGSLSPTGLYTAPTSVTAQQVVTVVAQSQADRTRSARSTITLSPPPQIQFTIDKSHLTSLSYNGQSFFFNVPSVVQGAIFQAPDGTTKDAGWSNPTTATLTSVPLSFQQVYNAKGPNQFTLKIVWSVYDSRTLQAVAYISNDDPVNALIQINLHLIGLNLPGPATQYNQNIPMEVNQYNGIPVSFLSGTWGSVAMWQSGYPTPADLTSYYGSASQTQFNNFISSGYHYGPNFYSISIPPGQTTTMVQLMRFGGASETATSLAPEAYAEYRAALPNIVNWPDRRPIAYWMISDAGNASNLNPRGYLWDASLDVSNRSVFQARVLASADRTINILNKMLVRPQGIIVWDLEGQEFKQAFTYIGYPNYLPSLAPEMDAVADQFAKRIIAAGYRIGVTVRPNHFLTGNDLPATCVTDTNYALADKFIKLNAIYPFRGYVCTAINAWSVGSAHMPSAQTTTQDYQQVLNLLRKKIGYAKTRWGATLFYIDSNVWEGGGVLDASIFRQLASEFPDCLLIPENSNTLHYGATAPYTQAAQLNRYGTKQTTRDIYPDAFGAINIADSDWKTNWNKLVQSVSSGDLLLFRGWWGAPEIPIVEQIYAAATAAKKN